MVGDPWFESADAAQIARERQKAKELKRSAWWKNQKGQGKCHYCGERFPPTELTMDHRLPLARGGRTTKKNVVVACKSCNHEKQHAGEDWQPPLERLNSGE